jgi:hypothetical protein
MKRWKVKIKYSTGEVNIHEIEEISELQNIVEEGPDFSNLKKISFEYQRKKKFTYDFSVNGFRSSTDLWKVLSTGEYTADCGFEWAATPQGEEYWNKDANSMGVRKLRDEDRPYLNWLLEQFQMRGW